MCLILLSDAAEPEVVIDRRRLEGPLVLGREPGPGGWVVTDPRRLLSRIHCELEPRPEGVLVRDLSVNGVFRRGDGSRLPHGEPVLAAFGEVLRLGGLLLQVEASPAPAIAREAQKRVVSTQFRLVTTPSAAPSSRPPSAFEDIFSEPLLGAAAPDAAAAQVPTDWSAPVAVPSARPPSASAALPDAALLEAFCEGAGLDPSGFVGQDPQAVMQALGQVYRQMVLGVSDLMSERVTAKAEYRMSRTTVASDNNNPFKWAGARTVAVDLLRPPADGFLAGPAAVNECFSDLKKHVLSLMAAFRAGVAATLEELEPGRAASGSGLLGRMGGGAEPYRRLHARVAESVVDDPDGPVSRAFRRAYETRLRQLDGADGGEG